MLTPAVPDPQPTPVEGLGNHWSAECHPGRWPLSSVLTCCCCAVQSATDGEDTLMEDSGGQGALRSLGALPILGQAYEGAAGGDGEQGAGDRSAAQRIKPPNAEDTQVCP